MTQALKQEQLVRDLRQLSGEVYALLKSTPADLRQAAELAQTAWRKLQQIGPVEDGCGAHFRALENGQIEWLHYDEVDGAMPYSPTSVVDALSMTRPTAWALWLRLADAESCTERLYADVKKLSQMAADATGPAVVRAQERWDEAETALRKEGVLPFHRTVPSAVGGARFVTEVTVGNWMVDAFHEALEEWGGVVVSERPMMGTSGKIHETTWFTISVHSIDDLFVLGSMMVLHHYAGNSKGRAHHE